MTVEPGKLYVAIMYYWCWPPRVVEQSGVTQEECRMTKVFDHTTANSLNHKVTDLREIAEFAIVLANHFEPISKERRIRLEVYEVCGKPLLVA